MRSSWASIQHRTTKVRSPRTNGFVERMNRTLLDECFRIGGRTKWYATPEELQVDLDAFLVFYNFKRSHRGYRWRDRTPAEALLEGIGLLGQRLLPPAPEEALMVSWRCPSRGAGVGKTLDLYINGSHRSHHRQR